MTVAIMQPYFLPYIGYFQLINAVDKFIFYDDVNFIKNGWINRNRIIINNKINYLTVQLNGASSNKLINEVEFTDNRNKLISTINLAYKRAPYFNQVFPLINDILVFQTSSISELAIFSIEMVSEFLSINTIFEVSSLKYSDTKGLEKAERLKEICHRNEACKYINPIGGQGLYNKDDFRSANIDLHFLKTNFIKYKQFQHDFISNLSIIDVLMFNNSEIIQEYLSLFEFK